MGGLERLENSSTSFKCKISGKEKKETELTKNLLRPIL
jgi:hypothetical protein